MLLDEPGAEELVELFIKTWHNLKETPSNIGTK